MSHDWEMDAKYAALKEVLIARIGYGGTLISCIPGRLAFYQLTKIASAISLNARRWTPYATRALDP
jgi:hypothetical protein